MFSFPNSGTNVTHTFFQKRSWVTLGYPLTDCLFVALEDERQVLFVPAVDFNGDHYNTEWCNIKTEEKSVKYS